MKLYTVHPMLVPLNATVNVTYNIPLIFDNTSHLGNKGSNYTLYYHTRKAWNPFTIDFSIPQNSHRKQLFDNRERWSDLGPFDGRNEMVESAKHVVERGY